ncbi:MAG TPA: GNAT family N-acetyltransferase [Actinoplanes sp.]|nr:GNAT family N-acetyltransferase [Actinoplanes sp.]
MIRAAHIEEHAASAWPASHTVRDAGWLLRHTPGVGKRRNNSALPVAETLPVEAAEEYYRSRGLPVTIQISPAEQHTELDEELAARGYRHDAPTLVLTAPVPAVAADARVEIGDITPAWRAAYGNDAVTTHVLDRITRPAGFASVNVDGEVAALGLFVAGDGLAGVFCMATAPAHRRRGHAAAILRAGAAWSADQGAGLLYLQVEEDNIPALRLYEGVGFTHSHSYHYRVRDGWPEPVA